MTTAIVYDTDSKGDQREVCRLRTVGGRIVPSNSHPSGMFVLNRYLIDRQGTVRTKDDGDEFLRLMPGAYGGSRLRVGLEVEGTKGDLPGHPFRGNQWEGGQGGTMAPDRDMGSGIAAGENSKPTLQSAMDALSEIPKVEFSQKNMKKVNAAIVGDFQEAGNTMYSKASDISKGFCHVWAAVVHESMGGELRGHSNNHAWVEKDGKCYDADSTAGVNHWTELKTMKPYRRLRDRSDVDVEHEVKRFSSTRDMVDDMNTSFRDRHLEGTIRIIRKVKDALRD